jgi:NAD(P)-dependent dehydrogenase (short-subunit alcohol dehydrogenase family)
MTEPVKRKTMIVTGASQGIGAGVTNAFITHGYNVVANSRKITESEFTPTDRLVLVDGHRRSFNCREDCRDSDEHFRLDRWCGQ